MIDKTDLKIAELLEEDNIAELLSKEELDEISRKVIEDYEIDLGSRQEWCKQADDILKLAKLTIERKDFPLPNSANVKFPLITTAVLQYGSRLYPQLFKNNEIIGTSVQGPDPTGEQTKRAKRISDYMNYQLLEEYSDWEENTDRLLNIVLTVGVGWKKIYYNPIEKRNISELCTHEDVVINHEIASLDKAQRISHIMHLSTRDLVESMRADLFCEIDSEELDQGLTEGEDFHEVIEQHRYLDLDNDGYSEPYIVTVLHHNNTPKILRIKARFDADGITYSEKNPKKIIRIAPIDYFEDFHCLRSPDGKYHSYGLGTVLLHGNKAVNSILNILINAGKNSSLQTLIVSDNVKLPGGIQQVKPGSIYQAKALDGQDLAKSVVPIKFEEPSKVLYDLLGLLIAATKELSTVTDVLTGQQPAQNVPATTISILAEEGKRIYSSIQRRFNTGLAGEFKKLYRLNSLYMDESVYYTSQQNGYQAISRADFDLHKPGVCPVADLNRASDRTKAMQAQSLIQLLQLQIPGLNIPETLLRIVDAFEMENGEKLVQQPKPPAPDPHLIKAQTDAQHKQAQIQLSAADFKLKQQQFQLDTAKAAAEIAHLNADTRATTAESHLDAVKTHIDAIQTETDNKHKQANLVLDAHKTLLDHEAKMAVKRNADTTSD